MVAEELASPGSVKEHGLRGFTHAADWALTQAGLVKEKQTGTTINIDKQLNVSTGSKERIRHLLSGLAGASDAPQAPGDS
jgi:hypothetical protein